MYKIVKYKKNHKVEVHLTFLFIYYVLAKFTINNNNNNYNKTI